MSNVEYRCPKCGLRLFAPPGGTHVHCPNHTDTLYEQTEDYQGPNFSYVEEGEVAPNKTGVPTMGAQSIRPVTVEPDPKVMSEDEIKVYYRERYREISGERPDMRWGTSRLKEEIEAWERGAEEEAEAQREDEGGQPEEQTEASDEPTDNDTPPEDASPEDMAKEMFGEDVEVEVQ